MAKNISLLVCAFVLYVSAYGSDSNPLRREITETFVSQLGVREKTGENDGEPEKYLHSVGALRGAPWCAAFVSWCFQQHNIINPRSAWSPNYFSPSHLIYHRNEFLKSMPQAGDVFGIWFEDRGRIAHIGFVMKWEMRRVTTVEGNTNDAGGRDGDGVYKKYRLTNQIYMVSDFIR